MYPEDRAMIRRHTRLFRLLAPILAVIASPASAATWIWPDLLFSTPCAGSLQACVNNAAHGDTILIGNDSIAMPDRYTGIGGDLSITKALTLAPMPGIDAVFEGGSIFVTTPAGVVGDVTLRGLVLRGGRIDATVGASTTATVTVDQVRVPRAPDGHCAIRLATGATTIDPQPRLVISNSRVDYPASANYVFRNNALCVYGFTHAYRADVFGNVVQSADVGPTSAIGISGGATMPPAVVNVSRNRIFQNGDIGNGGIFVQHNNPAATQAVTIANNIVVGAGGAPGNENAGITIKQHAVDLAIVNNTFVGGGTGIYTTALGDPLFFMGRIANNLIADQTYYGLRQSAAAVPNDHNLLFDIGTNDLGPGGALGPGTLTADPLLESPVYPRPLPGSPAIDAGDSGALPTFTLFDADGEKRQQGIVDIGAIEFSFDGTRRHEASVANTFGNDTALDAEDYIFPLFTTDRLVVSPLRVAEGVSAGSANLGVYQSDTFTRRWAIFHQDLSALPVGRRYAVLLPWDSRTAVLHTVSAASIPGAATAETEIDHPSLNNQPAAIAVVTPNWNPANTPSGIYHDHPITLVYRGNRWRIRNDDAASMNSAIGASFNLAVAPPFSPNGFMAELGAFAANEIALSHPLLDDNPCAAPVASRRVQFGDAGLTLNNTPFALEYRAPQVASDIGRWYIVAEDALGFSAHHAFNVIIDGAQANRCLAPKPDALFANGFE